MALDNSNQFKAYQLVDNKLIACDLEDAPVAIYVNPSATERQFLRTTFNADEHTLSSALDPDEISRLELRADHIFLVWKIARSYSGGNTFLFDVASIGILLEKDKLAIIATNELSPESLPKHQLPSTHTLVHVVLEMLLRSVHHYLEHLRVIKLVAKDLQQQINTSMDNQLLLQMFNLMESLVFYINALTANGAVLTRLKNYACKIPLHPEVTELIDDIIIESEQCYKQAEIYSSVLAGMMEARSSLVNNNINTLLKNLTLINIVFLPLNLIAGVGGMSEFSTWTQGVSGWVSYPLLCAGMALIGYATIKILRKLDISKSS